MLKREGIQNFFRAKELYGRLQQAREYLGPTIFNPLFLTGLPKQYQNFIASESFNPSGDYTDRRKRLLKKSIGKEQRLEQSSNHVAMPSKSFCGVTSNNYSRRDGKRVVNCNVCGILSNIGKDCKKKEGASCNVCKQKKQLHIACGEEGKKSLGGETNQALASICAVSEIFEVNKNDLVVDSGSTDQIVFDRKLSVHFREQNDVVLSPIGGKLQIKGVSKFLSDFSNNK